MPTNYDFIIGSQLSFFSLHQLFAPDPATDTDTLLVPAGSWGPGFRVTDIRWQLADVEPRAVLYHADFSAARLAGELLGGQPFIAVRLDLAALWQEAADWVELADHLGSADLDEAAQQAIFQACRRGLGAARRTLRALYFRSVAPRLSGATTTGARAVFLQKNTRHLPYSYLCLGEMLPGRKLPEQAALPVGGPGGDTPDFLYYLSPYAYLRQGLYPRLEGKYPYPQGELVFEADNELRVRHLVLDKQEVGKALNLPTAQLDEALIEAVNFRMRGTYLTITFWANIQIFQPAYFGPLPTNYDNSYAIHLTRESSYELYLEAGQLRTREVAGLRRKEITKVALHPELARVQQALNEKLHDLTLLFVKYLLPVGLDLVLGGNFLVGVLLLSFFETQAAQLDDFFRTQQRQLERAERASIRDLQVGLAQLLPFNVSQQLLLSGCSLQDGLVLTGHLRQPHRRYLRRGDYLLPGETLLGEGSTCLTFQDDGNLVLYCIRNHEHRAEHALWCSHGNNGYDTIGRAGDKVVLDQTGHLVMQKGNDVLWRAADNAQGDFLCVSSNSIRLVSPYSYQLPLFGGDDLDYAALFPADSYDRNYCTVH